MRTRRPVALAASLALLACTQGPAPQAPAPTGPAAAAPAPVSAPAAAPAPATAARPAAPAVAPMAVGPGGWVKEFGTMWTFDAPPLAYWKAAYDFAPTPAWLDHVRLSAARLPGCSGFPSNLRSASVSLSIYASKPHPASQLKQMVGTRV